MEKFNISSLQNMAADRGVSVGTILKGVVLAYAIALIIFLIFAALITYSDFPESTIPTLVVVTTIFSIVVAGARVARRARNKGWLNGAISGLVYVVILYFISALAYPGFVFDRSVLYMLILGVLTGAFGGVIGINLKSKYHKKK